MNALYYNLEMGEYITIHLLRFYENGYVIAKKVNATDANYFAKELRTFMMVGHAVKGEPEYTFCGAYHENAPKISFKVENEIRDSGNTWAKKAIHAYAGTMPSETEMDLVQTIQGTTFSSARKYLRITDADLLLEARKHMQ